MNIYNPKPLSKAQIEQTLKGFIDSGVHISSSEAKTLGYVIRFCELNKIPFVLQDLPDKGYELRRLSTSSSKNILLLEALKILYENSHVNNHQVNSIVYSILGDRDDLTKEEKEIKDKLLNF